MTFARTLGRFLLVAIAGAGILASAAPFAYIPNSANGTVSVIDIATNTVVATAAVGIFPTAVAVNLGGTRAYIANQNTGDVSVIDTSTNTVVATIGVGSGLDAIALNPAGTLAYATSGGTSGSVSVIDTATNTVTAVVGVGAYPQSVAVTPDGARLYVPNQNSDSVSVIATATNAVSTITLPPGTRPYGVAFNPSGTRAYVTSWGLPGISGISVIDTASDTVVTTVGLVSGAYGIAVNPAGTLAYVTQFDANVVIVLDLATNTIVTGIVGGVGPYGIALDPSGAFAYVANGLGADVSVIDTATNTVGTTISVGLRPRALGFFIGGPLTNPPPPPPLTCSISVNDITSGDSITLTSGDAIVTPGGAVSLGVGCNVADYSGATFLWSNGDTNGYTTVTGPAAGVSAPYSVTVTTPTGTGTATRNLIGALAGTPACTLTPSVSNPIPPGFTGPFTVTAACSPGATSFNWLNSQPNVVAGQGTTTATYQFDVTPAIGYGYTVQLTPANAAGQGPDATRIIWIQPLSLSTASLAFPDTAAGTQSAAQTITVSNLSDYYTAYTEITTSGPFAMTHDCPSPIQPLTSCTVSVSFAPTAAGAGLTGTIDLYTGFPGNSALSVALQGNGLPGAPSVPSLTLTPSSLVFGSRTILTTSSAQTSTLTNLGPGSLDIASFTGAGDFAFTTKCPSSLPAESTCDIDVTFTPIDVGTRLGSVTIASNASGSPHTLALSGAGQNAPVPGAVLIPGVVEFAPQLVGSESALQFVTLLNDGTAPLAIGAMNVSGDFAFTLAFTSTVGPCGASLAPGASCEIAVTFRPTTAGVLEGGLDVATDAPAATLLRLVGTGVLAPPPRALTVAAALAFDAQRVGTTSPGKALAIANNLASLASITQLSATGDFAVFDTCTTISAHGACSALVTFQPRAEGDRTGTLTLRTLSETQPYVVQLSGRGIANPLPELSASITQAGFGNAFMGLVVPIEFNLRNIGQVPLVITNLVARGDFFAAHACSTIVPGGTCPVTVYFMPRGVGRLTGTLFVNSNAEGSPLRIELSGVGCSFPSVSRARLGGALCGP